MKKLLLTLFAFATTGILSAQNDAITFFSLKNDSIVNGTTQVVYGDGATKDIKITIGAVMDKQDSMLVAVKRQEISYIPGSNDYFCWFLCYPAEPAGSKPVWEADDSLWMYMNDTVLDFTDYLQPEMNLGQAQHRFVFYPGDNPTDSVYFDIMFDIVTVGQEELNENNIEMFPNPVENELFVNIPADMKINSALTYEIYDLTGKQVNIGELNSGSNTLELGNELKKGSYVIRVMNQKELIFNKKFIKN